MSATAVDVKRVSLDMIDEVMRIAQRMRDHDITPRYVKMSARAYKLLRMSMSMAPVYGATYDEIAGLPIVICDGVNGVDVVPSAHDMLKNDLL